jgi:alkylation response protein AidB-like acyl-CoA dehydrogenase
MDYRDSPEEAVFRARLRDWLKVNALPGWRSIEDEDEQDRVYRAWHRSLYRAGYMGLAWPIEYGGQGLSPVYDAILNEEVGNTESPPVPGMVNYMGRAVYTYGTGQQKQRFLPTLLNGEVRWCQGFSEPDAGSDLASLRTRAELAGDRYAVNGQKMWTSFGQFADWCMLLVRTDPDAPKHRGISCLMVSMGTPGITVRPTVIADAKAETCEIFFDDVLVPVDQRIGEPGAGWRIAMTTVAYERGPADIGFISSYRKTLREVEAVAAKQGKAGDPEVRKALAQAYVRGEALRLHAVEQLSMRIQGKGPGPEGSIGRLLWTEAEQSLQHLAMDLIGADALTGEEDAWLSSYFRSRPVSVYGGSSQIQKNILALQVLGMPR